MVIDIIISIFFFTNNKIIQTRLDRTKWTSHVASKQFDQEHNNIRLLKSLLLSVPRCRLETITQPTTLPDHTIDINTSMNNCHQYAYQAKFQCTSIMSIPIEYYPATLFINNIETPTTEANHMRYAALSPDLRAFFKQKYKWTH